MGDTTRHYYKQVENSNTILNQKDWNNENWQKTENYIEEIKNQVNNEVYIGAAAGVPSSAKIWIDPSDNYRLSSAFVAVGTSAPTGEHVVLWLDTDN